jgi:chemotaxis protein CheD
MSETNKIIDVSMSNMHSASDDHVLRSIGIGSCIVVTLYDPAKKIGAMSHSLLPLPSSESAPVGNLRFVESAIDVMIVKLEGMNGARDRFEAKIIGGANMFKVFDKDPKSIGIRNAEAAKAKLEKENIKIVANDTGGNVGRSASLDLSTGYVEIKTII